MKKNVTILFYILILGVSLPADTGESLSLGVHILFGGRYDDVRMCVGSAPGVKGGPIGDIYLDIRFPAGDWGSLVINLPVMRPILFAAAFNMLQFEPQITYEYPLPGPDNYGLILGGGLGLSIHYGPDYTSSRDNPGESFFALGPLVSGSIGIEFDGTSGIWTPGLKVFYSPLFSPEHSAGNVTGATAELHFRLK